MRQSVSREVDQQQVPLICLSPGVCDVERDVFQAYDVR